MKLFRLWKLQSYIHIVKSSISCCKSLHQVLSAVDAIVLLLGFGCKCARNRLDMALKVGVAEITVLEREYHFVETTQSDKREQRETYAMLYLAGCTSESL